VGLPDGPLTGQLTVKNSIAQKVSEIHALINTGVPEWNVPPLFERLVAALKGKA
jgi:hypothetical protein